MVLRQQSADNVQFLVSPCWDLSYSEQISVQPDKLIPLKYVCSNINFYNYSLNYTVEQSDIKIVSNSNFIEVVYDKEKYTAQLYFCDQQQSIFMEDKCTLNYNVQKVVNQPGVYFFQIIDQIGTYVQQELIYTNQTKLEIVSSQPEKIANIDSIDYPYQYFGQSKIPFYQTNESQLHPRVVDLRLFFHDNQSTIAQSQLFSHRQQFLFKSKEFNGFLYDYDYLIEENEDSIIEKFNPYFIVTNTRLNLTKAFSYTLKQYTYSLKLNNNSLKLEQNIYICNGTIEFCESTNCTYFQFINGTQSNKSTLNLNINNYKMAINGICNTFSSKINHNYYYQYTPIQSLKSFKFIISAYSLTLIILMVLLVISSIFVKIYKKKQAKTAHNPYENDCCEDLKISGLQNGGVFADDKSVKITLSVSE